MADNLFKVLSMYYRNFLCLFEKSAQGGSNVLKSQNNTDGKIMTTGVIKNISLRGQNLPVLFTKLENRF